MLTWEDLTGMYSKYKLIVDSFGKDKFKFNEPLANYTASGIGGPAKLFFIAFTENELIKIITFCRQLHLPYFLFGTGSKIMISDRGFDGLMIKNRTRSIQTVSVKGKVTKFGIGVEEVLIEADSGVSINKFLEYLNSQNLETADFEGIPGSIGGNLFFSKSLQSHTKSIKILDKESAVMKVNSGILRPKEHIIISAVLKIKAKSII